MANPNLAHYDSYQQGNPMESPFPNIFADQAQFQITFGHGLHTVPHIPDPLVQVRRSKLVREEYTEFTLTWDAIASLGNQWSREGKKVDSPEFKERAAPLLAKLLDDILDCMYVLIGTGYEYGLPLAEGWKAVQAANMNKLWTWEQWQALGLVDKRWQIQVCDYTIESTYERKPTNVPMYIVRNEYGKIMKPPTWHEPDLLSIVKQAMGLPPKE